MIRIAFLGCDSTHTEAFASRINPVGAPFYGRARVVSIWGEDFSQATVKAASLGIDRVAAKPIDALADIDLVMVIGRFGESHFVPTMIALEAGLPTFVDKPFTVSSLEATQLAVRARELGVPLVSASPLRFAKELLELKELIAKRDSWKSIVVTVPANCTDLGPDPRLNSAFFYGIHGLEMLLELAGHDIKDTKINYASGAISVTLEFGEGRTALFEMIRDTPEFYEVGVYTSAVVQRLHVELDGSYYESELSALFDSVLHKSKFVPIESTLAIVDLLESIEQRDPFKVKP